MLGDKRGQCIKEYSADYVLYDLETTGLNNAKDDVVEISAVKVRNGVIVEEFSRLINPGRHIPDEASTVNNITDEMVRDCPGIDEVLPEFLDFIGDDMLVGHNIRSFDMGFMYRYCNLFWGQELTNDYLDTLMFAKECFPKWKHRTLADLSEYYGIDTTGAHRALADCRMNQQVYENMHYDMNVEPQNRIKPAVPLCPDCQLPMKKRCGKFGEFWGCSGYPDCTHTKKIRR